MKMPESLGFSVYLSTFERQWPNLSRWSFQNAPVFLSLNMGKGAADCGYAESVCRKLAENGFRVIADVSTETLELFHQTDLLTLARQLKLWALRIDFGFTTGEISAMAREMPIVLNASTTDPREAEKIVSVCPGVFAMHNFYPRPETGLDRDRLQNLTKSLQAAGLKVQAFIPGDKEKRGPVFEGLPTLEAHRQVLPSAAFADLALTYGMDDIFVGDPGISEREQQRIALFSREGILSVPAVLEEEYAYLYGVTFTCRVDSPAALVRFEESRTSMKREILPEPERNLERTRGSLTMDNRDYDCYGGEIQMIRRSLPADRRVNVIGRVPENGWLLMDLIRGGQKFRLVTP